MLILFVHRRVHERRVTRKSDGSEFKVRFQEVEIRRDDRRPRIVEVNLQEGSFYDEGLYTLSASSFRPDKYDRLELGYPELVPLDQAIQLASRAIGTR